MSRAADPLGEVPGRAGLNPLRVQAYAHVTKAQLDVLAQVAATIPAFGPRPTDYVDILGSCNLNHNSGVSGGLSDS